jgi:hypothetical protein
MGPGFSWAAEALLFLELEFFHDAVHFVSGIIDHAKQDFSIAGEFVSTFFQTICEHSGKHECSGELLAQAIVQAVAKHFGVHFGHIGSLVEESMTG